MRQSPTLEPVPVTPLKLREIVVRRVAIHRNLLNLRHNPLLPVCRELGKGLIERFGCDDAVHPLLLPSVTFCVKRELLPMGTILAGPKKTAAPGSCGWSRPEQRINTTEPGYSEWPLIRPVRDGSQ